MSCTIQNEYDCNKVIDIYIYISIDKYIAGVRSVHV